MRDCEYIAVRFLSAAKRVANSGDAGSSFSSSMSSFVQSSSLVMYSLDSVSDRNSYTGVRHDPNAVAGISWLNCCTRHRSGCTAMKPTSDLVTPANGTSCKPSSAARVSTSR